MVARYLGKQTERNAVLGKPRGKPFQKGNPGRPQGSRNKTSIALEAMLDGKAEAIMAKMVELALAGDRAALRLSIERILPPRKDRPISVDLPAQSSASDAAAAMAAILSSVASGRITLGEGLSLTHLIEASRRAFEVRDFESRIEAEEKRNEQKS